MLKHVARLFLQVLIPAWPKAEGKPKFKTQLSLFRSQLGFPLYIFEPPFTPLFFMGKKVLPLCTCETDLTSSMC